MRLPGYLVPAVVLCLALTLGYVYRPITVTAVVPSQETPPRLYSKAHLFTFVEKALAAHQAVQTDCLIFAIGVEKYEDELRTVAKEENCRLYEDIVLDAASDNKATIDALLETIKALDIGARVIEEVYPEEGTTYIIQCDLSSHHRPSPAAFYERYKEATA
ncbi:Hypothetical protein POVN_LOCUS729 [uncultured virus]|nr:Hypothetical protein POVN_LOCUS729 [uncultured virus]